jgi:hypothetical protein
MGYSWVDGNLLIVGNPGIGWSIAWRRWVTVIIGEVSSHAFGFSYSGISDCQAVLRHSLS